MMRAYAQATTAAACSITCGNPARVPALLPTLLLLLNGYKSLCLWLALGPCCLLGRPFGISNTVSRR